MNWPQVHVSPPSRTPSPLPPHPILPGCHTEWVLDAQLHAPNLPWLSVLHVVMCMFQCYSLKSSHPLLLPLSPKVCSSCLSPLLQGFPGGASGKEPTYQFRRHKRCGFDPWVRKIPWRRAWQPTPVFLPGEFHGQRSPAGYSP